MIAEAKDCFEEAFKIDEQYAMAYFNAGRAYELSGDKITAAKYYGKAHLLNIEKQEIANIDIEEKIHNLFEV